MPLPKVRKQLVNFTSKVPHSSYAVISSIAKENIVNKQDKLQPVISRNNDENAIITLNSVLIDANKRNKKKLITKINYDEMFSKLKE